MKQQKLILLMCLLAITKLSFAQNSEKTDEITITGKFATPDCPEWVHSAVFYQIYPQTFYDTNGDGIGDLQGIIEKLDYVKSLGVDCIWINPFFESPFNDAGYDISDYYKVAPRYGTNDDAKRLFEEAHRQHHLLPTLNGSHQKRAQTFQPHKFRSRPASDPSL